MDQKAREVIGLSVAVILGFNIGDGNLRYRLKGDVWFLNTFLFMNVIYYLKLIEIHNT